MADSQRTMIQLTLGFGDETEGREPLSPAGSSPAASVEQPALSSLHDNCRVYEPYGMQPTFVLRHFGKKVIPQVRDVAGNPVTALRAWGIANLVVDPPAAGSE